MPYIPPEVIEQARQIDLLTYLQNCEPHELVRISGNNYTTRIALDDYEHGVVIRSLNDKKTDLKKEGKSTDAVDDLIIKIGHAPRRKFKVVEKESCRESR